MKRPSSPGLARPGLLILALGLIALVFLLLRSPEGPGGPQATPDGGSQPGILARNARVVGRFGGLRDWELTAEVMEADKNIEGIRARGIRSGTIYKDGKPYMRFNADEASLDARTRELKLMANVRLWGEEGEMRLEVGRLVWAPRRGLARAEGSFSLELHSSRVAGDSLELDVEAGEVRIRGDVRIMQEKGEIRCREAVYLMDEGRLEVRGQTRIDIDL